MIKLESLWATRSVVVWPGAFPAPDRTITAMALSPGTRLGRFEIHSAIGAGGMGEVYRARDVRLDRTVAIKVLPEHLSRNAERRTRFEREARIISRLSHPHICVLHDIGQEGGTDFLVMEYLDGESLAERLRRGRLPLADVLQYAIQLADGLAKAHEHGIVHRDLKPANIIITAAGVLKVLDFGLASMRDAPVVDAAATTQSMAPEPRTEEGRILGTVAYMSPEQAEGARVDARSDIFSLGSVLYELVTGRRAFHGASSIATLSLILQKGPPPIREVAPDVPDGLEQAILRCLEKDPNRRFQHAGELRAVLEGVRATGDVRGRPAHGGLDTFQQATRPPARIRQWGLRAFALLALVGAFALAFMYNREREQNKNLRRVAAEAFYQMRALDGDLVSLRRRGSPSNELVRASYRRGQLEREYDRYLELVGLYAGKSPSERAVMRMARRMGETDLDVPPGFHTLAMKYVDRWRIQSSRLRNLLNRARQQNLLQTIRLALDEQELPKEFVFVALQESGFDTAVVGPQAPGGIPKGLWQLSPGIARRYGLTLGPLSGSREYDALDERHDAERSTAAAVRHLADLYSSQAAASALLVIASYSVGQGPVIAKLDDLPNDPRDRNFWNFYSHKWLPEETLDYVMLIFAVALVCEQPDLFNMPIDRF